MKYLILSLFSSILLLACSAQEVKPEKTIHELLHLLDQKDYSQAYEMFSPKGKGYIDEAILEYDISKQVFFTEWVSSWGEIKYIETQFNEYKENIAYVIYSSSEDEEDGLNFKLVKVNGQWLIEKSF